MLKTFTTPHDGKLVMLKIKNNEAICCTSEHPFLHVDFSDFNSKSKGLKTLTERKNNNEDFKTSFKFSTINKLSVGDLLTSPVIHRIENSNLNVNRARALGIWAAEGSFSKKYNKRQGVNFTLGITEHKQANMLKEIFEEEFPECSVHINPEPERSVISIRVTGGNIAEYFFYHCGEYSHEKRLSKELVFANDEIKKSFLVGWLDGDGCKSTNNKLIGISVSPHMSYQIRFMLNAMKIGSSLRKIGASTTKFPNDREYNCRPHYRLELYGNAYKKLGCDVNSIKYAFEDIPHKIISNFEDDYSLHYLSEVGEIDFTGNVYNFEVEDDHSYIANGIVVHNCDIFPEEELLKAYKQWIGKPLCVDHKSSSVDAIRGIILDTYYDRSLKRVIGLCALDKVTYPDLAKKVSLGYSTCVSMGTAVSSAICTDCGNVAKTEKDFCSHMVSKSCYGEINVGLNPIELSIVVNGADPQAKIRTIIAAANTVNNHLAEQEQELTKLSDSNNLETDRLNRLKELEEDLKNANEKLAELKDIIESSNDVEQIDAPYGQSSGRYIDPSDETNQNAVGLNFPERYAYNTALLNEVTDLRSSLEGRLHKMENILDKLQYKEETMSTNDTMNKEAYFQGGGGVNEPTPGQKKYPVDPLNEQSRSKDKQMVGESPFPDVGPVDGMHPSPASVDQKDELERKKMLARAEQEERSMRRAAALQKAKENIMNQKEAYFQGGGGVNEPAPHKVKYPIDKLNEELRDNEDKQMVGQKPFPDVGPVDGMHPSPLSADQKDELARKKLLQRASLKARFVRVANPDGTDNLGDSAWQVYAKDEVGEKLVFSASVNEISGGRSDALFDVIATKEFGTKMLDKIRAVGITKAASVYKKAQAVTGPGANPVQADIGGAGQTPAMPDVSAPVDSAPVDVSDEGGKGDPKETALKLAEKMRDMSSDLLEAVRSLTGEQSQMGEMEEGLEAMPKAAAEVLSPLYEMRKDLNSSLISGTKKSLSELRDHVEELELIASVVDSETTMNPEYVNTIVEDAFEDAKKALADAHGLVKAFGKYARGTAGLVKRAEEVLSATAADDENDARKKAKKSKEEKSSKKSKDEHKSSEKSSDEDDSDKNDVSDESLIDDFSFGDDDLALPEDDDFEAELDFDVDHDDHDEHHDEHDDEHFDGLDDLEMPADDMNNTMVEIPEGQAIPAGAKAVSEDKNMVTAEFDLTSKEGRAAYRAKLAADATGKEDDGEVQTAESIKFSDMLDQADGLADGQTQLDVKPSDELGKVETPEEQIDKDLEVARMEPKVREAARLNQLITEGKISTDQLNSLISQGLDPEVVKYWKQYYGQAGKEGAEFAKLLTTETMKAKAEEDMKSYKVKVARAYELANDMVRRGLLTDDRTSVSAQVDEIMKWNDEAFESMKRVVAKHAPLSLKKEASGVPQVGLIGSGDQFSQNAEVDFQSELDRAFSGRKY